MPFAKVASSSMICWMNDWPGGHQLLGGVKLLAGTVSMSMPARGLAEAERRCRREKLRDTPCFPQVQSRRLMRVFSSMEAKPKKLAVSRLIDGDLLMIFVDG